MKQRLKWVDVVRCFGIFAIYLGHFGDQAGHAGQFVTNHYVEVFFFISGCLAQRTSQPFGKYVKKICSELLLPWLFFSMLSVVFHGIYMDASVGEVLAQLKVVALGTVVDQFVAGSLWFFMCLALVKLLFYFVRKVRSDVIMLLVCLLLFLFEAEFDVPRLYNMHRALRFLVYYAFGNVSFPFICRAVEPGTVKGRMGLVISGIMALGFSVLVYFDRNPFKVLYGIPLAEHAAPLVTALIIIWLYIVAAKATENVELLNELGKNTLYLCGSEYFIKQILKTLIRLIGLEPDFSRTMAVYAFVVIMLLAAYRYLVPLEKKALEKIRQLPGYLGC